MTNFSPGWNISLGTKYEIAREESRENQAAMLFPAFQPGLKFLFDDMRFFQPELKILARFDQTGLGFSARAELHPGWIPLHVIDNLILRGFLSEAGLKFQPG